MVEMEDITLITYETKIQPNTNDNVVIKEECVICYDEYKEDDSIMFDCKHKVCISCYQNMINNIPNLCCPICRKSLESQESEYNDNENNENNRDVYQFTIITRRLSNNNICFYKICNYKVCRFISILFLIFIFIYLSSFVK
jgi:hypothetical protein